MIKPLYCQYHYTPKYHAWCDSHSPVPCMPCFIASVPSPADQCMLAQARCGCSARIPAHHDWHQAVPFPQRLCTACGQCPGDLFHILLQCLHPDLVALRSQYRIPQDTCMHSFFWEPQLAQRAARCMRMLLLHYPALSSVGQTGLVAAG